MKRWWLLSLVAAALAAKCSAQSVTCSFPFMVEVTGDRPSLNGIEAKNLSIRFNGRFAHVKRLTLEHSSQVIVLLDDSGSMEIGRESLLTLAQDLLTGIPVDVKDVGLTTFSTVAIHSVGRKSAFEALASMRVRTAYGKTKLLDSMEDSARYFMASPRTLMIVITDGVDNISRTTPTKTRDDLLRRGVRVIFIKPTMERPATAEEMVGPEDMESIAKATGGTIVDLDVPWREPTAHVLSPNAVKMLLEYYSVLIDSEDSQGKLKVELKDSSNKKARDLKVDYPRELKCVH